ncbi:unnamed protein product [Closterium sp. NIES-65]|nr:unnamed protein product [Closterium sp. NIES-65]
MPFCRAALPCPVPRSHNSLPRLNTVPAPVPYRASLPCLDPVPRSLAPVAARGCYLVRSATIDKGKDSGGWRGGGLNPWSEWRMRVWKKPELRVGDTLVFKWRGFLNDVAITVDKKQIDTCNITVAFLLHQTTWSGRYKLLIPKDT